MKTQRVNSDYFRPEAIKKIQQLEVRARFIVEGLLAGRHKSPFFGQSLQFVQHREYVPGDDLRRIDWKVWGKQDRFYIKQFEDETNLHATLLLDGSKSMRYASGPEQMTKFDYAATLAVSIGFQLLQQQDAVGAVCFDSEIRQIVPQRTGRAHLNAVIQALEMTQPQEKTSIGTALLRVAELFPKRGLVILFSDLFVPGEELWKGIKSLRSRGHEVLLFHILADEELDFKFQGPTSFQGLELSRTLRCNPRALRDGYLKIMNDFLEEIRLGCAKNQVAYVLARTSDPFDRIFSQMFLKKS